MTFVSKVYSEGCDYSTYCINFIFLSNPRLLPLSGVENLKLCTFNESSICLVSLPINICWSIHYLASALHCYPGPVVWKDPGTVWIAFKMFYLNDLLIKAEEFERTTGDNWWIIHNMKLGKERKCDFGRYCQLFAPEIMRKTFGYLSSSTYSVLRFLSSTICRCISYLFLCRYPCSCKNFENKYCTCMFASQRVKLDAFKRNSFKHKHIRKLEENSRKKLSHTEEST